MTDPTQQTDVIEPRPIANVKRRQSNDPKPSSAVKRLWHAACFHPRDNRGRSRGWKKLAGSWKPLKIFVRGLKEGVAEQWFSNK